MARDLEVQTNVDPASADYPSGRMRNDPGDGTGTPVSEALNGDLLQFFQAAMRDAGITPNDLPDNTTNGFQLNEAVNLAAKLFDNSDFGWINTGLTYNTMWGDNANYPVQYRKIGDKVEWRGKADSNLVPISGANLFSIIPASLVPLSPKYISVGVDQGGNRYGSIEIRTGETTLKFHGPDGGTNSLVTLDGIFYYV